MDARSPTLCHWSMTLPGLVFRAFLQPFGIRVTRRTPHGRPSAGASGSGGRNQRHAPLLRLNNHPLYPTQSAIPRPMVDITVRSFVHELAETHGADLADRNWLPWRFCSPVFCFFADVVQATDIQIHTRVQPCWRVYLPTRNSSIEDLSKMKINGIDD